MGFFDQVLIICAGILVIVFYISRLIRYMLFSRKTKKTRAQAVKNEKKTEFYTTHYQHLRNKDWKYNFEVKPLKGFAFEFYIRDLLEAYGFLDAKVTHKESYGDYGADVVAKYVLRRCVFQCKHYTKDNVGVDTVLELMVAKYYYRADAVFVITSSGFSSHATHLANKLGYTLIGYNDIKAIIDGSYNFESVLKLSPESQILTPDHRNIYFWGAAKFRECSREEALKKEDRKR